MGEPDCGMCEWAGFRTCDTCGDIVMIPHPLLGDICHYCISGEDHPPASGQVAE